MKRWKKALSCVLVLIMIVCLLPVSAFAADPEPFVFVARTNIIKGGYWTVDNDANEEHSVLVKCEESDNWNVSYDPATATLTLRDATLFSDCAFTYWSQPEASSIIYYDDNYGDQGLNLVLLGENHCTANPVVMSRNDGWCFAIGAPYSNLSVSGGGILDVHVTAFASEPEGNDDIRIDYGSYGINVWNMTVTGGASIAVTMDDNPYMLYTGIWAHLDVEDGSVTINVGNARNCIGVESDLGLITVGQHGSLTVTTGDANWCGSLPLNVEGIKVFGGTVTAISGNGPYYGWGCAGGAEDGFVFIEVSSGTLTVIGQDCALFDDDFDNDNDIALGEGVSVLVNERASADGAAPWDGKTLLVGYFYYDEKEEEILSPYKYVQITDGKQNEPPADPALGLLGGLLGKAPSQVLGSFVDVAPMDYYYDAVNWAVENDITTGTGRLSFSPDEPCTRAQAVTFLWRAAGCPAPADSATPFTDVEAGSYYEKAVAWAVENGVTKGTSATTFSPYASCTRAQIVTFLYRAFGAPVDAAASFTDVAADAYYAPAVAWAAANRVTGGTAPAVFSPDAPCTRAQIVTFLYRCCS